MQAASIPMGIIQFVPTVERILYGSGIAKAHVADEVARLGSTRVLLLTPRSIKDSPIVSGLQAALGPRLVGSFSESLEHVPLESALAATEVVRRCHADLILALGGGSVIDAGKALRLCLAAGITSPEKLGDFMESPQPLEKVLVPQVSIPTTLSGSEYTRSFSATDFSLGIKRSYVNSMVASRTILYDPVVTLETPRALWLSSGVMAVNHAVEVFCTSPPHLVGDTLKTGSLQQLLTYLPRTAEKPEDMEARLRCQVAAWQVDHSPLRAQPLSAASGPLYSHALAYELGALCHVPYGTSACVTLPACLRWYAERLPRTTKRQATLARSLQLAPREAPDEAAAECLANGLADFIVGLGLPTRLRETSVALNDLERIASQFAKRNAVPPQTGISVEVEVLRILESAW